MISMGWLDLCTWKAGLAGVSAFGSLLCSPFLTIPMGATPFLTPGPCGLYVRGAASTLAPRLGTGHRLAGQLLTDRWPPW